MAHILLIDDDEMILRFAEAVLLENGHGVSKAEDGEEGLRVAREDGPDLIITDMNMPKATGWDIIRTLKSDDATKAIPIIALSAHTSADNRDPAYLAGCEAYLSKPLNTEQLVKAVRDALPG